MKNFFSNEEAMMAIEKLEENIENSMRKINLFDENEFEIKNILINSSSEKKNKHENNKIHQDNNKNKTEHIKEIQKVLKLMK